MTAHRHKSGMQYNCMSFAKASCALTAALLTALACDAHGLPNSGPTDNITPTGTIFDLPRESVGDFGPYPQLQLRSTVIENIAPRSFALGCVSVRQTIVQKTLSTQKKKLCAPPWLQWSACGLALIELSRDDILEFPKDSSLDSINIEAEIEYIVFPGGFGPPSKSEQ